MLRGSVRPAARAAIAALSTDDALGEAIKTPAAARGHTVSIASSASELVAAPDAGRRVVVVDGDHREAVELLAQLDAAARDLVILIVRDPTATPPPGADLIVPRELASHVVDLVEQAAQQPPAIAFDRLLAVSVL